MSIETIEKEHPLSCEFDIDARYTWPKRWKKIEDENKRLIIQVETLSQEKKAIKTQYARDLVATNEYYFAKPFCKNQPPEITNGYNACLSCPMRKTCLLIFERN